MKIEQVKKLSPPKRLAYWIAERENIHRKKDMCLQKPWTDDEILQSYRFCNVRRIDDAVSMWLYNNWYKPYKDHKNMLVACALARFVNLPASLQEVGFPERWDPKRIMKILRKRRARGEKIFNGAYVVRGNDGMDKVESVVMFYVDPLAKEPPKLSRVYMQDAWRTLSQRYGFGSFMAGQVLADMRWATSWQFRDKQNWAPMGPGSKRGMNRFLGRPLKNPLKQEEFVRQLRKLMERLGPIVPDMEAIDWQNCLCEFDGYERVLWSQGRKKERYPGKE